MLPHQRNLTRKLTVWSPLTITSQVLWFPLTNFTPEQKGQNLEPTSPLPLKNLTVQRRDGNEKGRGCACRQSVVQGTASLEGSTRYRWTMFAHSCRPSVMRQWIVEWTWRTMSIMTCFLMESDIRPQLVLVLPQTFFRPEQCVEIVMILCCRGKTLLTQFLFQKTIGLVIIAVLVVLNPLHENGLCSLYTRNHNLILKNFHLWLWFCSKISRLHALFRYFVMCLNYGI